jgi:hypothetical protein
VNQAGNGSDLKQAIQVAILAPAVACEEIPKARRKRLILGDIGTPADGAKPAAGALWPNIRITRTKARKQ